MSLILQQNLARVRNRLAQAAASAGRSAGDIGLVAVTKAVSAEVAAQLARLGVRDLGESRADELESKKRWFAEHVALPGSPVRWHFIGHLQRNKARLVVECADVIESVNSERLLETLAPAIAASGRSIDLFLQVMVHHEPTKSGLAPEEVGRVLARARSMPGARVVGLMAIAPLVLDDEKRRLELARSTFTTLARLAAEHSAEFAVPPRLSMGMSSDFELAIAAGSHSIRVGSMLFEGLKSGNGHEATR